MNFITFFWYSCGFVFILVAFILYLYKSYWKSRNIPFVPAKFPYGNLHSLHGNEPFCKFVQQYYNQFKGSSKCFGLHFFWWPVVVITDPHLAETILTSDFSSFTDRSLYHNERDDPLSGQLVLLPGEKARRVRTKITPAFAPTRMKDMFANIISVTSRVKNYLSKSWMKKKINIEDLSKRYTIDVIGAAAFGIECNSLEDPENEFKKMCETGLSKPRHGSYFQYFLNYYQNLGRFLRFKLIPDEVSKFFTNIVQMTISDRELKNTRKKDFLDVLIDIRKGLNSEECLTMNELTSQAFAFFTPGFDTISTTMTFMLYEIAKNPDVQAKARLEIEAHLGGDNDMTYETVAKMEYLNQVISETLRKYPPFTMLRRIAVTDYLIPGTNDTLKKGTPVLIPVYSFHRDPQHFPNPDDFQPERIYDKKQMLAFGLGPRNCIGLRFSRMQLSIALIMFLRNFELLTCDRAVDELEFKSFGVRLSPKDKVYLKLNPLQC